MAEAYGMNVAAWSPLGNGILSGKYTRPGGPEEGNRVQAASLQLSEHDLSVARVVDEVAASLGASSSQVALAWTRARSRAVHPIIGARTSAQLADNLGAVDLVLPPEAITKLEAATGFVKGFPHDFIDGSAGFVLGAAGGLVDGR